MDRAYATFGDLVALWLYCSFQQGFDLITGFVSWGIQKEWEEGGKK